jgi:hypothetical protein
MSPLHNIVMIIPYIFLLWEIPSFSSALTVVWWYLHRLGTGGERCRHDVDHGTCYFKRRCGIVKLVPGAGHAGSCQKSISVGKSRFVAIHFTGHQLATIELSIARENDLNIPCTKNGRGVETEGSVETMTSRRAKETTTGAKMLGRTRDSRSHVPHVESCRKGKKLRCRER